MKSISKLQKHFVDKYDVYLSQMRSDRLTVNSMKIQVGELLYVRIFKPSKNLKYLKSILPRFKLAKVISILGATSLLLLDESSGRTLVRHLSDVYKVHHHGNFSNLYLDSLTSQREELRETFDGVDYDDIPVIDGLGKNKVLEKNGDNRDRPTEENAETAEATERTGTRKKTENKDRVRHHMTLRKRKS